MLETVRKAENGLDMLIGKTCVLKLDSPGTKKVVTSIVGYDTEDGDIIVGMPNTTKEKGWSKISEQYDYIPKEYRDIYSIYLYISYENLDTMFTDPTTRLEWAKDLIGRRILVAFPWFTSNDARVEVQIVGYNKYNNLPIIEVPENNNTLCGWHEVSEDDMIDDKYINSNSGYLYLIEGCVFEEVESLLEKTPKKTKTITVSDSHKEYNIVIEKCNKEVITIKVKEGEIIDKLKEIRDSYNNAKDGDFLLLEKTLVFKRQIKDINVLKI